MTKLNISDDWITNIYIDGEPKRESYTFRGALEYRYPHISMHWNESTKRKYEREYNNIILPALENHNDKTIREYRKEDYLNALERIREKGYMVNGVRRPYSEATMHHFENLIYYVVFYASQYGLCENVLWGTQFELESLSEEEEKEEKVLLKKSLTIKQERNLAEELLGDIEEEGEKIALLLMWGLGLRNGEACGLNYGDIKPLRNHDDCYVAWIYKSTQIKSRELQSGGKTINTGRIIPVPEALLDFLNKRKYVIERMILENEISINIDELPICNNGRLTKTNIDKRCRSDEVTAAAGNVFEAAEISSRQIAYIDVELSEGDTAEMLKEKDPTAYLLRRNFATQMHILGLDISEMQYLIGHDVEDAYESRNDFVDWERIYAIHLKLKQREILNNPSKKNAEICIDSGGITKIHISANEIMDTVEVVLKSPNAFTRWYSSAIKKDFKRQIDVNDIYKRCYD